MINKEKYYFLGVMVCLGVLGFGNFSLAQSREVALTVPYILEVPAGTSGGAWKNACEEASIVMVDKYYLGKKIMNVTEGKNFMLMLFNKQNSLYGSNVNSDMTQTKYLIDTFSSYSSKIVESPTVADIKSEIDAGRPVITPHYGFDLHNKNIPFLRTGTSYHMVVVIGYDDAAKQFIVNDPGDKIDGERYRYGYELFMNSIHDYSYKTKKADGPKRAIFTYPKLVKLADSPRIYYLHNGVKRYISSPTAFNKNGWKWQAVNVVNSKWLNSFKEGVAVK